MGLGENREIAVELHPVIIRRRARRQDLDHHDGIGNLDAVADVGKRK
jgi:hypothetical protein